MAPPLPSGSRGASRHRGLTKDLSMADNFLERHRADYEQRKQEWLMKKRHARIKGKPAKASIRRPEDEAL